MQFRNSTLVVMMTSHIVML